MIARALTVLSAAAVLAACSGSAESPGAAYLAITKNVRQDVAAFGRFSSSTSIDDFTNACAQLAADLPDAIRGLRQHSWPTDVRYDVAAFADALDQDVEPLQQCAAATNVSDATADINDLQNAKALGATVRRKLGLPPD